MTTSLRVGLLLSGQLVEERVFSSAVTFGHSLRCALSVPIDGIPREHVLFAIEEGRFVLHPPPAAEVTGDAKRGKLVIGDATILFQEIATPPPAPRPQLPAGLRRTLADRIDRRLATILGASLAVHLAIATWAWMTDVETAPLGAPPLAAYEEIDVTIPDLTAPPPAPTPAPAPGPGVAAPVAPTHSIVRAPHVVHAAGAGDASQLASILTNADAGSRQTGVDLNKQLAAARDHEATIGNGTHTSRTTDDPNIDLHHAPLVEGPQHAQVPQRRPEQIGGRVEIGRVKPSATTTLTPDVILEWIHTRYMAGLQRCYRLGLGADSTLSGRVAISFTVDDRGKVIDPDASGVSSGVDSCITKQMASWRFPIPHDKQGQPSDASYDVSLALQPS